MHDSLQHTMYFKLEKKIDMQSCTSIVELPNNRQLGSMLLILCSRATLLKVDFDLNPKIHHHANKNIIHK